MRTHDYPNTQNASGVRFDISSKNDVEIGSVVGDQSAAVTRPMTGECQNFTIGQP